MTHVLALAADAELVGDYRISRVLGAGGFGITYLADEIALGRAVTIKEYFPSDFAARSGTVRAVPRSEDCASDYQWGLERFISEAKALARFDHRNIVRVYRYFEANDTAYMVLHFEEGQSLKSWLKGLGRAPRQKELDAIVGPLLDALETIHNADFLHRDIAVDNIIIRTDGSPVLIDFGSARGDIGRRSRTLSALVKPGYSPYEQYAESGRQQGPWTDIYALGATLYHAITGKRPPDSPSRVVKDEIVPAREAALSSYRAGFLTAIDRALQLDIDKRPVSIAAWRGDLLAPDPVKPGWLLRAFDRSQRDDAPVEPGAGAGDQAGPAHVLPPPDAPGPQGVLLDFIEGLREKTKTKPAAAAPAPPPQVEAAAPPPATMPVPKPSAPIGEARAVPKPAKKARADKRERRQPVRPRPIRAERRSWRRPLAIKLLIGAGIASIAVGLQDRLPRFDVGATSSVPSGSREPAPAGQIRGHKGGTTAIAFTDDGRVLATIGADATLKIWSAASGTLIRTLDLDHGPATALAVFGRRAVTGHHNGNVALWDLEGGDRIASFKRNSDPVWSVAFAGEPNRILSAGHDWSLALWDARSSEAPLRTFDGHEGAAQIVAYSPRGPLIASAGADHSIRLWSLSSPGVVRSYRGHRDGVAVLAFSPDGRLLCSAGVDGVVRLWSTSSHRLHRILPAHRGRVSGLVFAPSGEHLASAGEDGAVRIWDFRRGRMLRTFGLGSAVRALAYAPDGKRLAVASEDGAVRLLEQTLPRVVGQ